MTKFELRNKISKYANNISGLEGLLAKKRDELDKLYEAEEKDKDKINDVKDEISDSRREISSYEDKIRSLRRELNRLA